MPETARRCTAAPRHFPATPALLGLQRTSQGFALDATTNRGFVDSNGLFVVVGA